MILKLLSTNCTIQYKHPLSIHMSLIKYNLGPNFDNYRVLFFLRSFSKFFVLILFLVWRLSYFVLSLLVLEVQLQGQQKLGRNPVFLLSSTQPHTPYFRFFKIVFILTLDYVNLRSRRVKKEFRIGLCRVRAPPQELEIKV